MNKELQNKYDVVKKKYGFINLNKREEVVRKLVNDKYREALWQYVWTDVRPLLEDFEPKDAEVVREYFRLLYKSVLGDTNIVKSGFKIVTR